MRFYFDDIIKLEDFNINNFLIDEKSHKNVWIYEISCKNFSWSKTFAFNSILTLHNVYYKIFLEKCLYQLVKKHSQIVLIV